MISSLHLADKLLHITKEYLRAVIIDKIHVDSVRLINLTLDL